MNLTTVALLNGILDLGIILAVAAIMRVPFVIDRVKTRTRAEAAVYSFAAPLPEKLAA